MEDRDGLDVFREGGFQSYCKTVEMARLVNVDSDVSPELRDATHDSGPPLANGGIGVRGDAKASQVVVPNR